MQALNIQIQRFEGPLALLLHLIRREEMNIFDINIHEITTQYMNYIKAMRQLDLEVAGEFIAMAATLIHIKSKMLLPQYTEDGELAAEEDPRKELVARLLEYQKFQEASGRLYQRPLVGRDVFLRGSKEDLGNALEDEVILEDNGLFSLISAFRWAVKNMKKAIHRVAGELQSISERIQEMRGALVRGQQVSFRSLVLEPGPVSGDLMLNRTLITFLSLLELCKMGFISLFQSDREIYVTAKRTVDGQVVVREESYEYSPTPQEEPAVIRPPEEALAKYDSEGSYEEYVEGRWVKAATDLEIESELKVIDQEGTQHG